MRLNLLHEAYWQPIADHPGQLGKLDKRAKKNDKSFLVHPEDRKRWLKWFGGKKIKEDLDDTDVFDPDYPEFCSECFAFKTYNPDIDNANLLHKVDAYHEAHIAADDAAHDAARHIPTEDERTDVYFNTYNKLMATAGYKNRKQIKEDLDDTDVFTNPCDTCDRHNEFIEEYCNKVGITPKRDDEFHAAHISAHKISNVEKFNELAMDIWAAYLKVYERAMKQYGYVGISDTKHGIFGWLPKELYKSPTTTPRI